MIQLLDIKSFTWHRSVQLEREATLKRATSAVTATIADLISTVCANEASKHYFGQAGQRESHGRQSLREVKMITRRIIWSVWVPALAVAIACAGLSACGAVDHTGGAVDRIEVTYFNQMGLVAGESFFFLMSKDQASSRESSQYFALISRDLSAYGMRRVCGQ
jgi:hypothetical protein